MVPDYRIIIDEIFIDGALVVTLGSAEGTYSIDGSLPPENRWIMPSAWRVSTRDVLMAGRRVYADNEPLRLIMRRK